MRHALAIDIGGTKLAAGVVTSRGELRETVRADTPRTDDGEEVFRALVALIRRLSPQGVEVCGVGCGGPILRGEEVSPLHIPSWRGFQLKRRLIEATDLPTFVDNDAKALAVGEGWRGAAAGERNYMGMVVSTGIGGGIVVDGRLLEGSSGNAGHIGHVIVEPQGRGCECGARGCLEAEASGTSIAAITGHPAAEAPSEVRRRVGRLVGRAVGSIITLLDLRLVVVGGSVALGFGTSFFDAAQTELSAVARLSYARDARIVPAILGDTASLLGAAQIAWRGLHRD